MEQNLKLYVAIYLYCNNKNSKKKPYIFITIIKLCGQQTK